MNKPMSVGFYDLQVTISGVGGPKEAYDRLCNALASIEGEGRQVHWESSEYDTWDDAGNTSERKDTLEIMPTEAEAGISVRQD